MPSPAPAQSAEERDFVPGEKAVFCDDYTDMAQGAVRPDPDGRLLLRDRLTLYPNIQKFPKNFTAGARRNPARRVSRDLGNREVDK